jgi:hypothetical protein
MARRPVPPPVTPPPPQSRPPEGYPQVDEKKLTFARMRELDRKKILEVAREQDERLRAEGLAELEARKTHRAQTPVH